VPTVTTASVAAGQTPGPRRRAILRWLHGHRRAQLLLLLLLPLGWLGLVYLGSLAVLFVSSFWQLDPLTSAIRHTFTLANFQQLISDDVYRTVALRTMTIAVLVTITDIILAFPISFYMARIASRRTRRVLLMLVLLPLWSSYLVRVYAWRVILQPNGPLDWFFDQVGLHGISLGYSDLSMWIVFAYIWLPYMILPLYAGFERLPRSLLEASADLGARGAMTFRRVILPLVLPAVAAGSIFTFSLTLGDYITPQLVSNSQFIGNVVYDSQGVANNVPFAAAFATVPVLIMGAYLYLAKRAGAFEAL
jgi:putative spermidine/putrescine transport system permease protein